MNIKNWYYFFVALYCTQAAILHAMIGQESIFISKIFENVGPSLYAEHFYSWHMHTFTNAILASYFYYAAYTAKQESTIHVAWISIGVWVIRTAILLISIASIHSEFLSQAFIAMVMNIIVITLLYFGIKKALRTPIADIGNAQPNN